MGGASHGAKYSEEKAENLKYNRHQKLIMTIHMIYTWIYIITQDTRRLLPTPTASFGNFNLLYYFFSLCHNVKGIYCLLLAILIVCKKYTILSKRFQ